VRVMSSRVLYGNPVYARSGCFGKIAAFNADYFGSKNVGTVYGLMITAWQFAGVLGSQLISYTYGATGAPSTSPRGHAVEFDYPVRVVRPAQREADVPAGAKARA